MTYEQATADLAVTEASVGGVAEVAASKHFLVDAKGNLVECTAEEVGFVTDEGTVATPADVTVH